MKDVSKSYGWKNDDLLLFEEEFDKQLKFQKCNIKGTLDGWYYAYVPSTDKGNFQRVGKRYRVPNTYFTNEDKPVEKTQSVQNNLLEQLVVASVQHEGAERTLNNVEILKELAWQIQH